jgi:hypothetical protein
MAATTLIMKYCVDNLPGIGQGGIPHHVWERVADEARTIIELCEKRTPQTEGKTNET